MTTKHKSMPASLGAILLTVLIVLSACGSTATVATPTALPQLTATAVPSVNAATLTQASAITQAVDYEELLLTRLYEEVNPSVVAVSVTMTSSSRFPGFGSFQQEGQGSGFVWDTQGHIVTNNHVVEGATSIEVTFSDGITLDAEVVGTDPDADLAVIKVNPADHELKPVAMGNSDALKVGQRAIAIGTPFGLESTLTVGVVSALGRDLPVDSQDASSVSYTIPDVIQTDAPINPGNSGGPLLNSSGEVIGVNSAIESTTGSSAGIGYAIPASIVSQVVPSLIQTGAYRHPWLGVSVGTLDPDTAESLGLSRSQRGAVVVSVTSGGPADKAGLKGATSTSALRGQEQTTTGGDVILKIDSTTITRSEDLISYLVRRTAVGQQITLTVLRDGKEMQITVTLAERPTTQDRNALFRTSDGNAA